MNIVSPAKVAANRTARLVAEGAHKPRVAYTSDQAGERRKFLALAEKRVCTEEWCFVCSRPTDHLGEHDDEQILRAAKRMRIEA